VTQIKNEVKTDKKRRKNTLELNIRGHGTLNEKSTKMYVFLPQIYFSGASWPNGYVGLSTRGSWVRIPAKARCGICEQDTLKSTARGSHNKQNCLRHPLPQYKKKKKKYISEDSMTEFNSSIPRLHSHTFSKKLRYKWKQKKSGSHYLNHVSSNSNILVILANKTHQ
jgi:hypothetical protein